MWNGIKRRASDKGMEPPEVVLARVDENIQFLKAGAETVRIQLHEHQKEDSQKFDGIDVKLASINKTIWMVSGGAAVLIFVINVVTALAKR